MAETMELGQAIFGNPTGDFGMPPYADALLGGLLDEIERVYWNREQKAWEKYEDPSIPGIVFRPYYWGDDEEKAALPNFEVEGNPQKVRWYKHAKRGTNCEFEYSPEEWARWFDCAYAHIKAEDLRVIGRVMGTSEQGEEDGNRNQARQSRSFSAPANARREGDVAGETSSS